LGISATAIGEHPPDLTDGVAPTEGRDGEADGMLFGCLWGVDPLVVDFEQFRHVQDKQFVQPFWCAFGGEVGDFGCIAFASRCCWRTIGRMVSRRWSIRSSSGMEGFGFMAVSVAIFALGSERFRTFLISSRGLAS
jgi:hypothetical protein